MEMGDATRTSEDACKVEGNTELCEADADQEPASPGSSSMKDLNNFSEQLQNGCFDTRHKPKSDVDSFANLFETWKNQEISAELVCKAAQNDIELLQKKLQAMEQKLKDVNKSNELMQKAVDTLYTDLDWADKVTQDNKELKDKVKQLQEQLNEQTNEQENKCADYEEKLEHEKNKYEEIIENTTANLKKQLEEHEAIQKKQEELHKQEIEDFKQKLDDAEKKKANEIAALTVEYEDRFAKLQRLKAASSHNQPQTSSNQEIFRKKLQQLRSEYETETKILREQIKALQSQFTAGGQGQRSSQSVVGRQTAKSPVPTFAKRPRHF